MREKEYGGYLPLELADTGEYFTCEESEKRRYNCGRTAIYWALADKTVEELYVPYFICNTVIEVLQELGIPAVRYYLDERMLPAEPDRLDRDCPILLVNYFGGLTRELHQFQAEFQRVILDNTQAFFAPPLMREGVTNIYSCRKFIGVPDGAYLIEKNCKAPVLEPEASWPYYSAICQSFECGTNSAYRQSLEDQQRFEKNRGGMSVLTEAVLKAAPYDRIAQIRMENYTKLHSLLRAENRLNLPREPGVPYLYPFWAGENCGVRIRQQLLRKHIYTPVLWKECLNTCEPETLEYRWSRDIVYLPVDQRYGPADMQRVAQAVLQAAAIPEDEC